MCCSFAGNMTAGDLASTRGIWFSQPFSLSLQPPTLVIQGWIEYQVRGSYFRHGGAWTLRPSSSLGGGSSTSGSASTGCWSGGGGRGVVSVCVPWKSQCCSWDCNVCHVGTHILPDRLTCGPGSSGSSSESSPPAVPNTDSASK